MDERIFLIKCDIKTICRRIKYFPAKTYRKIRNGISLRQQFIKIGADEFHPALGLDPIAMMDMSSKEQEEYHNKISKRRKKACGSYLAKIDPNYEILKEFI